MKKRINKKIVSILIIIVAFVLIFILSLSFIVWRMDEDSWIKDSKGIYVKHGNPAETPAYVSWQKAAIVCANDLFTNFTEEKNSQCLGTCGNYAIDIVHVPRTAEDDLTENQCPDYGKGFVSRFIELDKNGEIARIE
jgi:hypothetical protein